MKKRKAPITLISILIVCGAAAVIVNLVQMNPEPERRATNDLDALGGPRVKVPQKDLFQIQGNWSDGGVKKQKQTSDSVVSVNQPKPVQTAVKPKPTPTGNEVSGQWYTSEHAHADSQPASH